MKQFQYTIKDELGVHARPAGLLVKLAKQYTSTITIASKISRCFHYDSARRTSCHITRCSHLTSALFNNCWYHCTLCYFRYVISFNNCTITI